MKKGISISIIIVSLIIIVSSLLSLTQYNSNTKETILYNDSSVIKKGEIEYRIFEVYSDLYITLSFNSNNYANIYLLSEAEYNRYKNAENFYSLEEAKNSYKFQINKKFLQKGKYVIIIEAINSDINYNLQLTSKIS